MRISIVVPAYNVERFLEKCIVSIVEQDHVALNEFEIIIVNDGSTDNSLAIAYELKTRYPDVIQVITQSNQGLSAARNRGMAEARGEYIWFIDSDDWIAENSTEILFNIIEKQSPEVIHFRAINSFGDKLITRGKPFKNAEQTFTGKQVIEQNLWTTCVPFYVFRRSFLLEHKLFFYNGIFHEDNEFTPRMLYYASKVCLVNDVLYYVYQNPNSITRSVNHKKSFDLITVAQSLFNFSNDINEKLMRQRFYQFISLNINNALYGTTSMDAVNRRLFEKKLRKNKELFKCLRHSHIGKYVFEGILFYLTSHYIIAYKLLNLLHRKCRKRNVSSSKMISDIICVLH